MGTLQKTIRVANYDDLHEIVAFLSQPGIDKGFCKPLSERNISIPERVHVKFKQGVWVLAKIEKCIVSCLAIIPEGEGVLFSTFACKKDLRSKLAGMNLWENSLRLSSDDFNASYIEIDSWVGNEFINKFLTKNGFQKIKIYSDPDKRPPSVKSVLYKIILR